MDPKYDLFMLNSKEAFEELKKICIEEYGDTMSDMDIRNMGANLLQLFDVLTRSDHKPP